MNNKKQIDKRKIKALRERGSLNPFPEKVRDPIFLNDEFFDPNDIVQVKYELLRRVQVEGASITDTVNIFGFSRLSFYRILAAFEELGLLGLIPKKRGPKEAHKISLNVLKFIDNKIQEVPSIKNIELKRLIEQQFKLSVHPRSIERALVRKKKKAIK